MLKSERRLGNEGLLSPAPAGERVKGREEGLRVNVGVGGAEPFQPLCTFGQTDK